MNILTVKQAAEKLQVSKAVMYRLCKRPDFPAKRLGGIIRISEDALDEWMKNKQEEAV